VGKGAQAPYRRDVGGETRNAPDIAAVVRYARFTTGAAQTIDLTHQKIGASIRQSNGEKEQPAFNSCAAIPPHN
jgi:hypothetical protein